MRATAPPFPLLPSDVHVWLLNLALAPAEFDAAAVLLAPDERERAGRFVFAEGRRRFTAARGQLRQILGAYLDLAAERVVFGYAERGKPYLAGQATDLQFNLAHSHEMGVVALAWGAPVGADIEYEAPSARVDVGAIAGRFFAAREAAQLASLPEAEQPAAFRRCWTRKEAIIKAIGDGLYLPLDRFEVSLLPHEPARLMYMAPSLGPDLWSLHEIASPPGYVAAVAVAGAARRMVECGLWSHQA